MRFLDAGLGLVRGGATHAEAAVRIAEQWRASGASPPGFGHRMHTHDPRAARLFQMALELELEGEHVQMIRSIERALREMQGPSDKALPINVDGAIAAVCGDLGLDATVGNALFIISRVPGLIAQAQEERTRHAPMRQIDPKDHVYDGPQERRLPETRK
jgi:citrate synthase